MARAAGRLLPSVLTGFATAVGGLGLCFLVEIGLGHLVVTWRDPGFHWTVFPEFIKAATVVTLVSFAIGFLGQRRRG